MNFFSINFLLFFLVVIVILKNTKKLNQRNIVLLISSYIFYGVWDIRFLVLLFFISMTVYVSGLNIKNKAFLYTGVLIPLVSLGLFKYFNFFSQSFSNLFGISDFVTLNVVLPLGISFYVFLAISYILDVYHNKIPCERNFVNVLLYISFFPTIVSGPITKARVLLPQIQVVNPIKINAIYTGVQFFMIGCIKKFVLADNMGVLVDEVYSAPLAFDSLTVWLAVISYSIQLYLDFSGYSDMAIGCAKCLGFNLTENFNMPYLAKNISEFWKRWHISLSSWLQEYLYFSLGGSHCSKIKTYRNLLVTMLVCGLWHGAAWNFILWGGIHGIILLGHKCYQESIGSRINMPSVVKVLLTFLAVTICWIFFRASDLTNITQILYRMFIFDMNHLNHMYIWSVIGIIWMISMSIYVVYKLDWNGMRPVYDITSGKGFFVFCLELYFILGLFYTGNNPFVYAAF